MVRVRRTAVVGLALATCLAAGGGAGAWWVSRAQQPETTPPAVSRVPTARRMVGLTFDDGPDPVWTPTVLGVLDRYGARATFFVVGDNARAHPELVREELNSGDEVGNHTLHHPDLLHLGAAGVTSELDGGRQALIASGAPPPSLFRPPYGLSDPTVAAAVAARRYRTVFWTLSVERYVNHQLGVAGGVRALLQHVRSGDIILAHDGGVPNRSRTMAALPLLLEGLRARGFRVVDVSTLMAAPRPGRPVALRS